MKLVVGLGNPEKKYDRTYHNVGFFVVDKFCDDNDAKFSKEEGKAQTTSFLFGSEKIIVAKPQTYMNLSGESVVELKNKYKLKDSDIYVICDDIDLPLGKVRLRHEGSGGTHNGLRNIVNMLGAMDFNRIKVGIGRDEKFQDLADFVLSTIPKDKQIILNKSAEEVVEILNKELGK